MFLVLDHRLMFSINKTKTFFAHNCFFSCRVFSVEVGQEQDFSRVRDTLSCLPTLLVFSTLKDRQSNDLAIL